MQYDFFFAHCAVSLVCWANQPSLYDGCVVGFGGDAEELTMVCTRLRLLVRWALSGQGGQQAVRLPPSLRGGHFPLL